MEDTLGVREALKAREVVSLNPCSNGILSDWGIVFLIVVGIVS